MGLGCGIAGVAGTLAGAGLGTGCTVGELVTGAAGVSPDCGRCGQLTESSKFEVST